MDETGVEKRCLTIDLGIVNWCKWPMVQHSICSMSRATNVLSKVALTFEQDGSKTSWSKLKKTMRHLRVTRLAIMVRAWFTLLLYAQVGWSRREYEIVFPALFRSPK